MNNKRVVIVYVGETDNIEVEYEVEAISDWEAIHIVAEHHPEIKTKDFDIMTIGLDL